MRRLVGVRGAGGRGVGEAFGSRLEENNLAERHCADLGIKRPDFEHALF